MNPKSREFGPQTEVGVENISSPEKYADNFWEEAKMDIRSEIDELISYKKEDLDDEEYQEDIDHILEKEEQFSKEVIITLEKAFTKDKKTNIFFDIDDTIGKYYFSEEANYYFGKDHDMTILRPSITKILKNYENMIKDKKLSVGFISNRSKDKMIDQLSDEDQLSELKEYVDKDLIYSTREETSLEINNYDELVDFLNEKTSSLVNKKFTKEDVYADSNIATSDNIRKLKILSDFKSTHKNESIVAIDDLSYPKYLSDKKDCYGVSVYDCMFRI